jgi:paraquat-inducible protein B
MSNPTGSSPLTWGAPGPPTDVPRAELRSHHRFSWIWVTPVVAAGLVLYLGVQAMARRGPLITITFKTADGLTAQQTKVKHKAVDLGTVEDIALSPDMSHVSVRVRMDGRAAPLLTDRARFWVVRPRFASGNLAGIASGLETLVSGAYIEIDPGQPPGREARTFTGLEDPPGVRSDEPGHLYVLHAEQLGSLTVGAPVFYRNVSVGDMLGYDLADGSNPIAIRIFVRAPFDRFVHADTRFWNASGLSIDRGAAGLRVEVESIQALISGGIAFIAPQERSEVAPPAPNDAAFTLYSSESAARAASYVHNLPCVAYFRSSIAGLVPGAPVQVYGVTVGVVTGTRLMANAPGDPWTARVTFDLQPERLLDSADAIGSTERTMRAAIARGVDQGLRVVIDSTNFVTGEKALSLQHVPNAKAIAIDHEGDAWVLPSQAGGVDNIVTSLSELATQLDHLPVREIGDDVRSALVAASATLRDVDQLARRADAGLAPALQRLPDIADQLQQAVQKANGALGENGYGQNSGFQRNIERLMHQVNETARSVRLLADFLDRHPEALIRGRSTQAAGP